MMKKIRSQKTFLAMVLTLAVIFLNTYSYALTINDKFIGKVFDKIETLDPELKKEAFDMLESYLGSPTTLNLLKKDLPAILSLVIGDDYKEKLYEQGISMDDLYEEIEALKSWTKEDRMLLLEYAKKGEEDKVKELYEKYSKGKGNENPISGGTSAGSAEQNLPGTGEQLRVTFNDIKGHWAQTYIEAMAEKGIIKGVGKDIFAPDRKVTRAEFTAMLVRLLNLEEKEGEINFSDVKESDWYYDVIKIAYLNGLAKGKGKTFEPNANITREEMVALVVRAAAIENKSAFVTSLEEEELLSRFKDAGEISQWARMEIAIALKLNLVKGRSLDLFAPKANATRAEAATMVYNLYQYINAN